MLLLQQQLQRVTSRKETRRAGKVDSNRSSQLTTIGRLKALAQLKELSNEEFERTLIQGLLIDEFGEAIVNDPRFQKMVDKVLAIISSDLKTRQLLLGAKRELMG
ncbi:MAG: hypothetical protein WA793_03630 [Sphingorhabdus sp.]|uniref:hypothetical protein n=1 Tax=Sphingorhabdus sp. TaxID=1902408 RepID=UPI003C89407B